jgi:hypothetical protein
MIEKKKDKVDAVASYSQEPEVKPKSSKLGLNVYRIEGFVQDVEKFVEALPMGEVPVEFAFESQNVRIMGKAVFLLVTKKDPASKLKCKVIDAMGIENLNKALQDIELTNVADMFIIPAQVNKRTLMQQYLAIIVGE